MDTLKKKVRLYRDSSFVVLCEIHYTGFLGMFILSEPFLIPKNTLVEVEFENNAEQYRTTKRSAVVTQSSTDGLGLTFTDINKPCEVD